MYSNEDNEGNYLNNLNNNLNNLLNIHQHNYGNEYSYIQYTDNR